MKPQTIPQTSQNAAPPNFRSSTEESGPETITQRHLQLQTIAILSDLGHDSEKSLHYAASLAQYYKSKLVIAHTSPINTNLYPCPQLSSARPAGVILPIEDGRQKIQDLVCQTGLQSLPVEVVINQSSIEDLLRELEQHCPDLLILATHGREGVGKLLTGSVTEQVFRKVRWPVLVHGPHSQPEWPLAIKLDRLLCAIDRSEASINALRYAIALAEDYEAKVSILHVETGPIEGFSFDRVMELQGLRDWVHSHILDKGPALQKAEYRVEFEVPDKGILKAAAELHPNLIVIGAHNLSVSAKMASHFVSGTAYDVASKANCPVLIIPHQR